MKYQFFNANPLGRRVNDCTVRAISLATKRSWDETYEQLSKYAQAQGILLDEVLYIDEYLNERYPKIFSKRRGTDLTVEEFVDNHPKGVFLITMNGHITCCVDGCIYDTFNPKDRLVWDVYIVDK
jgi:hypothetical protein